MSIKNRLEKLEKHPSAGKEVVILVRYEGDDTEPTEAQKEVAIADYKAKNPDWKEKDTILLYWKDDQFIDRNLTYPLCSGSPVGA